MTMYTYEFSAFTEQALLDAGSGNGSNLGYGDSFTMPASSDTTFIVTDNDSYLSGDSRNNENANDSSYQTAEIIVDGEEAGNGGQIYGEQYFWVWGDSGQWYLMIEIEQEGTGDDYFTFYNAYGVPEDGETLTVSCGGNISCWEPHMGCLESPPASIPPVAVLDTITITEGDSIGDAADDAQLNILENDFDTDGTISLTGVNGAEPGDVITVQTASGVSVDVTVDADGNVYFDSGAAFDSLLDGQSDSFELTYTITDNDGNLATSTVTVTIEGESEIVANDDVFMVFEDEGAGDVEGNVLANDTSDFGPIDAVLRVEGQEANVGEWIDLAEGGRVRLDANGDLDFDADGDFDSLNADEFAERNISYTIAYTDGGTTDEYQCLFFGGHQAGTIIADQYQSNGVTISGYRSHDANLDNPPNAVMIFDTANPTGGDWDLSSNTRGNVLIISENFNGDNPDDEAHGGTFVFDFDSEADIESLIFLDTEEPTPEIRLYAEDGSLIATMNGPSTADGEEGIAHINTAGVFRMEVELQGSGAIDNLIYTLKGEAEIIEEDSANVKIIIEGLDDPNAPPVAEDNSYVTDEETAVTGNFVTDESADGLVDSDADNDPLTVTTVTHNGVEISLDTPTTLVDGNGDPLGVIVVSDDGSYTFTPDASLQSLGAGDSEVINLTYTITDGEETSTADVDITINGLNDLDDDGEAASVDEGSGVTTSLPNALDNVIENDGGNPVITAVAGVAIAVGTSVAGSAGGLFTIAADGTVTFDTNSDFTSLNPGDDPIVTSVTYTVEDGQGGSVTSTYEISVNGTNAAPEADDDEITIFEDEALPADASLNILEGDADPDAGDTISISDVEGGTLDASDGSYTIVTTTENGVPVTIIVASNGDVTFDTGDDFTSMASDDSDSVSFNYTITDGIDGFDTATATINIEGLNEAPVAIDNTYQATEGEAFTAVNILTDDDNDADEGGVDFDPNGDTFTVNSALAKDADGNLTIVLDTSSDAFQTVYTDNGAAVEVKLDADGNLEMQDGGEIEGLAAGSSDSISLSYTIVDAPAEGPAAVSEAANVTINIDGVDAPVGASNYNIVFLVDASLSAFNASTQVVGDLNNDGIDNTVFDASLNIVQDLLEDFASAELGAGVDVGIFSFETDFDDLGNDVNNVQQLGGEALDLTLDANSDLSGVFSFDPSDPAFGTRTDGTDTGVALFDPALAAANGFFGSAEVAGGEADAQNIVIAISDGFAEMGNDFAAQLQALGGDGAGEFDASISALSLNAFGAFFGPLPQVDNVTGVTDVANNGTDLVVPDILDDLMV